MNPTTLAKFFHTQYLCGASSIQMNLEKTMEYILPRGIMQVECPRVSIINRYKNGTMVNKRKTKQGDIKFTSLIIGYLYRSFMCKIYTHH